MSTAPSSRAVITPPSGHATLQDVLTRVAADLSLPPQRRQDICSALRRMAVVFNRPLDAIPAHPGYLRQRLERFTPAMAGVTDQRWISVLSLVRAGLKHAGMSTVPGRYLTPMSPAWRELWRHINDRWIRDALSRLARYSTEIGVTPEQVDDAVLDRFQLAIT